MQEALLKLGFNSGEEDVEFSSFSSGTQRAVKTWQVDAVAGADSLKSCSCSFCIKAAYIWSELHYMDAKGRISALMKSKKEANSLVRSYSLDNGISMGRG